MSSRQEREIATLEHIYNNLPVLECKGDCFDSCGPIQVAEAERRNILRFCKSNNIKFKAFPKVNVRNLIQDLQNGNCRTCPYLQNNKCTIYPVRPLICRLYGMTEKLMCEHGCMEEPAVSYELSVKLLNEIDAL